MSTKYYLDSEDKKIIDELDNLFGVIQNKEVLKNMVLYSKLKNNNELTFGNYNIIIDNYSSYNILEDYLKICAKLFVKNNIIPNNKISYLERSSMSNNFELPFDPTSSIIVISNKDYYDLGRDLKSLENLLKSFPGKIFVFENINYKEGKLDAILGNLATWKMSIEKISLDDKLMYCKNIFEKNNIKFQEKELSNFADQPFWKLQNNITQLIVNSKADESNFISNDMLKKFSKGTGSSVKSERKQVIKIESAKEDMEKLIGLDNIKTDLSKILNYIKLNKKRGNMPTLHMCFTGNPGTGKTSVARIIGKLFSEEKILSGGGEFVEVHGRDLVGQFVGWTAMQVHDIVKKALGGVLFIDEAYSLVNDRKGGFEDEAIATLIKEMEDHRDEICIILAGYTNEMNDLLEKNPGFKSRIQFTINFPDYSSEELYSIFLGLCKKEKYILNKNCKDILIDNFEKSKKENDFGNGRYVRNLFEKIKFEQADRIIKTKCKNLNLITKKDINNALLLENSSKITANKRIIGF